MPAKTPNYNLIKPAENEFYDVNQFNQNADILDAQLKQVNDRVATITSMGQHGNEFHEPDFETLVGAQARVDAHASLTSAHGATSAAIANTQMRRDDTGRTQAAAGVEAADVATIAQLSSLRIRCRMGAM